MQPLTAIQRGLRPVSARAQLRALAVNARTHARTAATAAAGSQGKRVTASPFKLHAGGKGYINGKWVGAASGATLDVINPATAEAVHKVADMGAQEVQAAISAASAAFPAWAGRTSWERGALLRKLYEKMVANTEALAVLLTLESGKPFEEAKGEIAYSASFMEWFAEEGKRGYGDMLPTIRGDRRMMTLRQPVGVAALLTPWNFSSAMITRKLAPALAAGCTVVLRPSSNTPLSALAVVQLAEEVGIPAGVINLVVGDDHDALAGTLCRSPEVRKLSFTGSTRVGKLLAQQCAPTLKRLSLELGGNAAFIVFEDADIAAAVEGCILSKFRNAGQTCVCANRVYVHERVYDEFVARLTEKVKQLKVADGLVEGAQIGPVISRAALEKTDAFVQDAVRRGAVAATGGERDLAAGKGFFYKPTVLTNVSADMDCVVQEIFGPVAPIVKFRDEAEVLRQANMVDVGLAGYFFTRDLSRAWRVAEALEVGMVGVNTGIISTVAAPFGGVKMSGYGREGSKYGMDEYTQVKYVMMGV